MRPIYPSAALRVAYEQRLTKLVDRMRTAPLLVAYRQNPTVLIAQDADPAAVLGAAMRTLGKRWLSQFDELADNLAKWFATTVTDRSDRVLRDDLRKAGFTVKFTMNAAMRQAFNATRAENVSLIKSIPRQHLASVERLVQSSVAAGRDLHVLAEGLEKQQGVTKRRAAFIALDQNNKATANMQRARQMALGFTEGVWLHSAGGHEPRHEHVAFSGQRFPLATGHDFDNGEGFVLPGQAIRCRCVWKPVVSELD
jgi:uncharacterized protein with gpF-like domain